MPNQLVAEAIAYYDEVLASSCSPSTWAQQHVDSVRHHWPREVEVEAFALRPFFIDEATYRETCASATMVARALSVASERLAADATLRRAVGIPAYMEQLLEIDLPRGKPSCIGRLDGILQPDGRLTFIEFNSQPQSAPFQYELERSFDRMPIAQQFADRYRTRVVDLYEQLYMTLAARGRARGGGMPCVAILDKTLWKNHRQASWFRGLMYSSARGCPVVYVDPEELDYRNGKVVVHGIQIDMVAFLNWDLLINARAKLKKLLAAIGDGAVDVYAGISRGLLSSYKVVFELLSSEQYRDMFSADIARVLDAHIPWTRALRERKTDRDGAILDLVPFVANNRERLVIKPAGSSGGASITIGKNVTDAEWSSTIERGLKQNWIVQELAIPARQSFPVLGPDGTVDFHDLHCELTPYVWDLSRVEGVLCRVVEGSVLFDHGNRPVGLVNGIETATWIIDRR
jgi:hypothetical protein